MTAEIKITKNNNLQRNTLKGSILTFITLFIPVNAAVFPQLSPNHERQSYFKSQTIQ